MHTQPDPVADAAGTVEQAEIREALNGLGEQVKELLDDRNFLLLALSALKRDYPDGRGCWCEMAIGHPCMSAHSVACSTARAAYSRPR